MNKLVQFGIAITVFLSPIAQAHTLSPVLSNSILSGIIHPLLGFDHLLILLTMGVLAHYISNKTKNSVMFVALVLSTMATGMVLGHVIGQISLMELIITCSIFLGALTIWQFNADQFFGKALVTVTTMSVLFHGWAHGLELGGASLLAFGSGMIIGSLLAIGIGFLIAKRCSAKLIATSVASFSVLLTLIG